MTQGEFDWLRLQTAVMPAIKLCSLVRKFGSASAVFEAVSGANAPPDGMDAKIYEAIKNSNPDKAKDILSLCADNAWSVVTPDSEFYPERLKNIKDFPFALFCSGDVSILKKEPKISVVGTREPTDKALAATYTLTCSLSSLGTVTVSGGAQGIDSAAHEGALTGNGGTIAVLGTGLGADYLPLNGFMRRRIEKTGLLVSEFLPFTPPSRYTFPRRNRIISALSELTVVAESGSRGGSLITADYALKQGRRICCFDESIVSSPGCRNLVEKGATVFSLPGELLDFCSTELVRDEKFSYYADTDLHNNGITGVHIVKPSSMTAESFALYNGVNVCEVTQALKNSYGTYPFKPSPYNDKKKKPILDGNNFDDTAALKPDVHTENVKKKPTAAKPTKRASAGKKPVVKAPEKAKTESKPLPDYLSQEALKVFDNLGEEPINFDEIQFKTSLPIQDVMTAVTELELEGLVVLHAGNRVGKT